MFPVISDARLCRLLGLAKRVSGIMVWGPPTLSPASLFDSGWQAHVDSHPADSVVRARNLKQYVTCDALATSTETRPALGGMLACREAWPAGTFCVNSFMNISNDTSW